MTSGFEIAMASRNNTPFVTASDQRECGSLVVVLRLPRHPHPNPPPSTGEPAREINVRKKGKKEPRKISAGFFKFNNQFNNYIQA